MRYLCVHCDEKFELSDTDQPRCPKCLRLHGLRPLGSHDPSAANSSRKRWFALAAFVALLGAGGAYALVKRADGPAAGSLEEGPLSPATLSRELQRRGVQAGNLEGLLNPSAEIERFARDAVRGKAAAADRAEAITSALRARAKRNAFVAWSLTEPRDTPPGTAADTLAAIAPDEARKQLYPLELAALAVAAARSLDVPAVLVELSAIPGERTPLDPSGRLGYFALGLRTQPAAAPTPAARSDKDALQVFDVYGGRPALRGCSNCAALTDLEAVGAALSLRAGYRLAQNEDPALALRDADAAAKLLPSSATVRSSHGAVLLGSGARDLGQSEFEAAAQLRPDAPRRNNLAMLELATGDSERATQEVARALEQQPDFANGHVTLSQIHLARGERELAHAELQKAETLDPKLPSLPLSWAQFYASAGEHDQAIEYARRAADARPRDPQVHLMLARIYHQASRYDEMRTEARAALAAAPASMATQMRDLIGRLLGPTALESDAPHDVPGEALPGGGSSLTPGQPSLPAAPKASKLHLSDPGTTLQLRDPSR